MQRCGNGCSLAFLHGFRGAGASVATGSAYACSVSSGEGVHWFGVADGDGSQCVHTTFASRRTTRRDLCYVERLTLRSFLRLPRACSGAPVQLVWRGRLLVYPMHQPVCSLPIFMRPPFSPLFVSPAPFIVSLPHSDRKFTFWDGNPRTIFPLSQYLSPTWSEKRDFLVLPSRPARLFLVTR